MNAPLRKPKDLSLDLELLDTGFLRHRVAFPWSLGRAYASDTGSGFHRVLPQLAGAGLLSGDHVRQRVRLGPGVKLRLESAGAMLVLAGRRGAARSDWVFELGPGTALVLDAEPYTLLPRAMVDLRCEIRMDPSAILIGAEMMCHTHRDPGTLGRWRTETIVSDLAGHPLFRDRQELRAGAAPRLMALPDGHAAFGTIWVLGPPDLVDQLVADLPDPSCRFAMAALRGGAGQAIRLAARDGGTLRSNTRALITLIEARVLRHQAACDATELATVAHT